MAKSFRTLMLIAAMIGEAFALQVGTRVEHADDASAHAIENSDHYPAYGYAAYGYAPYRYAAYHYPGVAGHPGAATSYVHRSPQGLR